MQRRLTTAIVCTVATAACGLARESRAQPGAPLPAPRFGIMAGVNSSTIAGDEVGDDDVERRTGFIGGVYLNFPLGTTLSVQPELLYSMKGANGGSGADAGDFHQDYIEVPILLRADFAAGSRVRPYLIAGPTLSYRLRCNLSGEDLGVSASIDCDDFADAIPGEDIPEFKKFDFGAALGGGLTFGVGTASALNLGVRYTLGTNSFTDPGDAKNRALSVTAGLEFPFGGR